MVVAAGSASFRALRLRGAPLSAESLGSRWLILAPHPDDETLGAGGLIARLAASGNPAWVAFLTAGEASHVGAPSWPPERLGQLRRLEARRALGALKHPQRRVTFLRWRDGAPAAADSSQRETSLAFLHSLCLRENIENLATTWRSEGHCDHRAAYELAAQLVARSTGRLRLFEYVVWGWRDSSLLRETTGHTVATLDIVQHRASCRAAIARHRTQVSPVIPGATDAFRLSDDMAALASRCPMILLHERKRHAA
jgi:LmbE family N-acetylglucosaminyl deacetylase